MLTVEEIYHRYIKHLSDDEKRRLIALIENDLAKVEVEKSKCSIMELHRLGKEIWQAIDAQEYVNELRGEWEQ